MAANWSVGAGSTIAESRPYSTAVPEPGTLALLGLGAGALGMSRGRSEEREYSGRERKGK